MGLKAATSRLRRGRDLANIARRRLAHEVRTPLAERHWRRSSPAVPGGRVPFVLVFSGGPSQLYQALQWVWPLERLAEESGPGGVAFLCRDVFAAAQLQEATSLPVYHARRSADLDAFFAAADPLVAMYPNQNLLNFQALGYPRPAHVHLSHGESEKVSMVSNKLKAYDYLFVAGPAAEQRLEDVLIGLSAERLISVGRPQLDAPESRSGSLAPRGEPSSRVALYAPTWEGDSEGMSYSSIESAGVNIVRALTGAGWTVIFRPHPMTGSRRPAAGEALSAVTAEVEAAANGSYTDTSDGFGWQLAAADVVVADMSAVAFDALAMDTPLVMVQPAHANAYRTPSSLLDAVETLPATGDGAPEAVDAACSPSGRSKIEELGEHYFGPHAPGEQIARFIAAARSVARERQELLATRDA